MPASSENVVVTPQQAVVDKIQLVLTRTREHHGPTAAARSLPPQAVDRPGARMPGRDAALQIAYTKTAVIRPEPALMRRHGIVAGDSRHPVADAFRLLRTQLLSTLDGRDGNAVAVCAANPDEGKTFVAVNLAVSIAGLLSRSAILVDLDLRRPNVHVQFGIEPAASLSDYLAGTHALEDCLLNPAIDRLVLLMQATRVENSSELLASPRMAALARELRRRYPDRIVIFNTPPLLASDDALVAMGYTDGCLLVVREGRTGRAAFTRAAELIGQSRFLGSVLNNAHWYKGIGYGY